MSKDRELVLEFMMMLMRVVNERFSFPRRLNDGNVDSENRRREDAATFTLYRTEQPPNGVLTYDLFHVFIHSGLGGALIASLRLLDW